MKKAYYKTALICLGVMTLTTLIRIERKDQLFPLAILVLCIYLVLILGKK